MNALLLNDNLKNKALEQLGKLYPHEKITFDRWRKCISAYQAGYWTVPEDFDNVLVNCEPSELVSCLDLLNTCISTGATEDHIRWLFRLFAASKSSLLVEFLLSCAQITEAEQLEKAKKHITTGKLPEVYTSIATAHGIDVNTLQKWLDEIEPEKPHPILKTSTDIEDDILDMLAERHPEEQGAFDHCTEIIEFFEAGYIAGIRDCAENWKAKHITNEIQKQLLLFNHLFQEHQDMSAIRFTLKDTTPNDVYPLFSLLLDVAELKENERKEGENDE